HSTSQDTLTSFSMRGVASVKDAPVSTKASRLLPTLPDTETCTLTTGSEYFLNRRRLNFRRETGFIGLGDFIVTYSRDQQPTRSGMFSSARVRLFRVLRAVNNLVALGVENDVL